MPVSNKTRSLAPFFVFLLIIIPLFAGLYFLEPPSETVYQGVRDREAVVSYAPSTGIVGDRVTLMRGEPMVINRHRMVYRGITDQGIRIDLFLLELDPDYAYPQILTKQQAKAGFRMADTRFSLLSVNRNRLKLRREKL